MIYIYASLSCLGMCAEELTIVGCPQAHECMSACASCSASSGRGWPVLEHLDLQEGDVVSKIKNKILHQQSPP